MKRYCYFLFALLFLAVVGKAQFSVIHNFNGKNGGGSLCSLTLGGNVLYGMTLGGGANVEGNIFSIHTDGYGYEDLHDFNDTNGSGPVGTSLVLSRNILYGTTQGENVGNYLGNIFSIDTNGNGYKELFGFNGVNGEVPVGVVLSGSLLYGMSGGDGVNNYGFIFSIDTNGNKFTDLFDFNDTNGAYPNGTLIISGNVLYGMTTYGGANGWGIIFSIHTDGTVFTNLFDFNGTNGGEPFGSLTLSGSKLYGMTSGGTGATIYGNIFSIDTNGEGFTNLFNFDGTNGGLPFGTLTYSSGLLFGMTQHGGIIGDGNIFP